MVLVCHIHAHVYNSLSLYIYIYHNSYISSMYIYIYSIFSFYVFVFISFFLVHLFVRARFSGSPRKCSTFSTLMDAAAFRKLSDPKWLTGLPGVVSNAILFCSLVSGPWVQHRWRHCPGQIFSHLQILELCILMSALLKKLSNQWYFWGNQTFHDIFSVSSHYTLRRPWSQFHSSPKVAIWVASRWDLQSEEDITQEHRETLLFRHLADHDVTGIMSSCGFWCGSLW